MTGRGNPALSLVSQSLAFAIPVIIAAYWPIYAVSPGFAVAIFRPAVIGTTMLLALFWFRAPLTLAEANVGGLIAILAIAFLVPSITATDPARALTDWGKLMILWAMSLVLCRALRDRSTAKALGWSLIVASIIIAVLIAVTYHKYMGWVTPGYASVRAFKGIAERGNVPLNAVPFASLFSYIAGMCLLRHNWALWLLGVVLFVICCGLTGSRAPVVALLASGFILVFLRAVRGVLVARVTAYLALVVTALLIGFLLFHLTFKQWSGVTEGRWDLWSVAVTKFAERPVLGYGYDSWRDDLISRLPGEYKLAGRIAQMQAGGYHNELLTILAEEGLVGLVPALALTWFLLQATWRLGFWRWHTWDGGRWGLFVCLFLLIRSNLEVPGLFGYGQEPADYLAYVFLAIVVSRLSVEEDYIRSVGRATAGLPLRSRLGIALQPRQVYREGTP